MKHLMQWRRVGQNLEIVREGQLAAEDAVGIVVVNICVVELVVQKVCCSLGLN